MTKSDPALGWWLCCNECLTRPQYAVENAILKAMRSDLIKSLSEIVPRDGDSFYMELLCAVDRCVPLKIASNWRYNSLAGTVAIDARLHHEVGLDERGEHVHPITDGLLGKIHNDILRTGRPFERIDELQSSEVLSVHLSADRVKMLDLRRLICIPYYNLIADKSEADAPAGFLNLYPTDIETLSDDEALFVQSRLNQLETMQFLRTKDMLATETLAILSGSVQKEGVLRQIIDTVCKKFFHVEACSIYEWSTQRNVFTIAATTGLDQKQNNKAGFDFRGAGLVGEVVRLGKTLVIQDIFNESEVMTTLGDTKTQEELLMNMELLQSPPRSVLLVPIYNPAISPTEGPPIGVIRLVNKRCKKGPYLDQFSTTDISLATELSRLLAFYEDHKRLERSRLAFALQFGHEAQAPAVGIKGTAERLLLHSEDDNLPKPMRISMLQDIQSFAELLIAFSDSLTFGFADRSQPIKSRYRIRMGNVRTAIEQAKKVVTPICRMQNLSFSKINIMGTYPDIYFDVNAFTQVFYNLFTNAIKYRSRETGADFSVLVNCTRSTFHEVSIIRSSDARTDTTQRKVIPGYRVDVMDFGIGIPEDYRSKIFVEGYRVPDAAALEIRGSGIGLSVARNILRDFRCSISLSNPRAPTTFRIFIPHMLEDREYINQMAAEKPN